MRYNFITRSTTSQGNRAVNPKENIPSYNDNDQAPIEVNGVAAVDGNPAKEQKDYDVVDELNHVNVVQLAEYYAFVHDLSDVVLGDGRVLYPCPLLQVALTKHSRYLGMLLREGYCYYVLGCPVVVLVWLKQVQIRYFVL